MAGLTDGLIGWCTWRVHISIQKRKHILLCAIGGRLHLLMLVLRFLRNVVQRPPLARSPQTIRQCKHYQNCTGGECV